MLVNHEKLGQSGAREFGGGLGIYDVSRPAAPKLISKWTTAGRGVHRYDFDGRYAYISPTAEGYVGNIVMILDLADPGPAGGGRALVDSRASGRRAARPIRGTATCRRAATIRFARATGSTSATGITASSSSTSPTWRGRSSSRRSTRARPSRIPTHTCLPLPEPLKGGRKIMVVADEDVAKLRPAPPGLRLDLRHHRRDESAADRDLPGAGARPGRRAAAADDRLPPAVGALHAARSCRSPGSRKGCGSSTSPTRSRRARSATIVPDPPPGAAWPRPTT